MVCVQNGQHQKDKKPEREIPPHFTQSTRLIAQVERAGWLRRQALSR